MLASTVLSREALTSVIPEVQQYLIIVAVLCVVADVLRRRQKETADADGLVLPPGPWGLPVLGNLLQLGRTPHRTLTAYRAKFGDVYKVQMGSRPTVVLNGAEVIRTALVKYAEDFAGRPDFYTFNYIASGKSMGFSDYGPRWKLHRRLAQNALALFVNSKDNPMQTAIQEEAQLLIDNLSKGAAPIDPHDEVYLSVGNIICALCFGKRYRRDDPDFQLLVRMNGEFMAYAGAGNPVDIMPWTRHFTKASFQQFVGILKTMDDFCLKKRKEHLETFDADQLRDVTDALIRSVRDTPEEEKERVGLTDEHILITVQELIGAGFDTIATTLQWAILFMATHPEVQQRVQEEIDDVIGGHVMPESRHVGSLPYTEAVIYEIMRHSCIFPFALPHSTTKDTSIAGYHIPDKTLVFVNLYSVTRDESKFPEPEKFDPWRFLEGENGNLNLRKSALDNFFPFGIGRRRCPGEQLGRMEIFIFFVALMQNCRVEKLEGVNYSLQPKYGLTLKPQNFKVNVLRRDAGKKAE